MTALIRAATLDDAAALARIHHAAFAEPWSEDSLRGLLENPGAFALAGSHAAETDLQAFVLIQIAADESEILTIATAPTARRLGLARALILEAQRVAAQRQANVMYLEVAENNAAALALYRSCGFVLHGRRQAYYIDKDRMPADALMLRATLPIERVMGMTRSLD
ncbi:MAG TPA: GNAT family N-acetyltransferase [Micropepsaceae bacterium]|nr:GNAT family N-acetyltransferase [Micropepsaceae bacterium]